MTISASGHERLLRAAFASEAREQLRIIDRRLPALAQAGEGERAALLEELLREAHGLKGAARAAGQARIEAVAHELESALDALRIGGEGDSDRLAAARRALYVLGALVEEVGDPPRHATPVASLCDGLHDMVRDLARGLSKEVDLHVEHDWTGVDERLLDELRAPVVQMVRNCLAHGIEEPARREAAGKGRAGTVVLRALRRGSQLVIEVVDDGAGIDFEAVRSKAIEAGLVAGGGTADLGEREALPLILRSGFSTKREVTRLSGRGVGLDLVHERVERLGGTIQLQSAPGVGTTFTLRVPLSDGRRADRGGRASARSAA